MRRALFLIVALWSMGTLANECYPNYSEKDLINSVGITPEKRSVKKDDGVIKNQYEFRKEPTLEEAFEEGSESKYEPQFYITIYEPICPKKIKIWFYGGDNGIHEGNVTLASKAWAYLTGSEPTIFENQLRKFEGAQKFESYDEKANSLFMKAGTMYIVDVHLK